MRTLPLDRAESDTAAQLTAGTHHRALLLFGASILRRSNAKDVLVQRRYDHQNGLHSAGGRVCRVSAGPRPVLEQGLQDLQYATLCSNAWR